MYYIYISLCRHWLHGFVSIEINVCVYVTVRQQGCRGYLTTRESPDSPIPKITPVIFYYSSTRDFVNHRSIA